MPLHYVLLFSLLGSVGALTGAGALIALPKFHERLKAILLAYAVGALLGATFIGLLPEAISQYSAQQVGLIVLVAWFGFFLLEKFLRLPHAHSHAGERREQPVEEWHQNLN